MSFERIVTMSWAWDKRSDEPAKNYGIHGMDLRFVLKGERGAVQFVVFTNWQLPSVRDEWCKRTWTGHDLCLFEPMAAHVGYHALASKYEDQRSKESCEYLDGRPCYYDGSGLRAMEWMDKFLVGGTEWPWPELERYYGEVFTEEQKP